MSYPFQTQEYRDLFKKHFVTDPTTSVLIGKTEYEILPNKCSVLMGMKPVLNGQEITDYGDIDNASQELIQGHFAELKIKHGASSVQFDYVREDSLLFSILSELSSASPTLQEVSPSITLPASWEVYLESLERTDRKELKRKIKRLDSAIHDYRYNEDFEVFIKLHTLSNLNKSQFMSDPMKAFFNDLLTLSIPGWSQKLAFLYIEDKPAASLFYFENEKEILLYNSGYDPEQKYYSGGLLLTAHLIKKSIEEHKQIFDFLRGNERYKYDLGGKDVKLFRFIFSLN